MDPRKMLECQQKYKAVLRPDTLQSTYLGLDEEELEIKVLKFNDGSVRVSIPGINPGLDHRYCVIEVFVNTLDDLSVVGQIKDIVDRHSKAPKDFTLRISSTAYSRYDRVMLEDASDAFGAQVFANFVNALNFNCVYLMDNHSEVLTSLIKNCRNINQDKLVKLTLDENQFNVDDYLLIAPDKGALKKLKNPTLIFDKTRDVATGQITGMYLADDSKYFLRQGYNATVEKFLVVDDICEGGRTFIQVAKEFKKYQLYANKELNLYVTHGIFSNNAIPKLLEYYNNIFVFGMKLEDYENLTSEQKRRVYIYKLMNA